MHEASVIQNQASWSSAKDEIFILLYSITNGYAHEENKSIDTAYFDGIALVNEAKLMRFTHTIQFNMLYKTEEGRI